MFYFFSQWVQGETSPSHSTSVKISSPHMFSPFSANPKEFKDKQKAVNIMFHAKIFYVFFKLHNFNFFCNLIFFNNFF